MKKLWVLLPVLCLVAYAAPAAAQGKLKAEGFYIGASGGLGLTKLDIDEINLLDDSSVAWKAITGYRSRNFAMEFDYRSLSEVKAIFPGSELTASAKGFATSALLILPLGPVDLYGRGGVWRASTKVGFGADIVEDKQWAWMYGAGLAVRIGSFSLRAEYERPSLEAISNLHIVTGGFTVAF
jgi:hypothetical protein